MISFTLCSYFCAHNHQRSYLRRSGNADQSCITITLHEELPDEMTLKGSHNLVWVVKVEIAEF